jgi:hypothetical protein
MILSSSPAQKFKLFVSDIAAIPEDDKIQPFARARAGTSNPSMVLDSALNTSLADVNARRWVLPNR